MISPLGIISIAAAFLSVCVLIFVYKILRRRSEVDAAYTALDNFSRNQLEIIFKASEDSPEADDIREMCEMLSGYETRLLYRSLPNLRKSVPETDEISEAALQTDISATTLNEKIDDYNTFSKTLPARFFLPILGITGEKKV